MKTNIIVLFLVSILFSSCMKDAEKDFYIKDFRSEFQDAVVNNNAVDKNYPLLTELRNNAGVKRYQVNLIGGVKATEQIIPIQILSTETTAVLDQHYKLPKGAQVVIPAQEAIGYFEIEIPSLSNTTAVNLVLELGSTAEVKASANHKTIGLRIRK